MCKISANRNTQPEEDCKFGVKLPSMGFPIFQLSKNFPKYSVSWTVFKGRFTIGGNNLDMFLRAQKVSNAKKVAGCGEIAMRRTGFSWFSDFSLNFQSFLIPDVLDIIFQAHEILIAKSVTRCGKCKISPCISYGTAR